MDRAATSSMRNSRDRASSKRWRIRLAHPERRGGERAAARLVRLPRVPTKQAQARGFRFLFGDDARHRRVHRQPRFLRAGTARRRASRCSARTAAARRAPAISSASWSSASASTVEAASELCADVADPAPLSGRCPVILKTDMTHLANKGEDRGAHPGRACSTRCARTSWCLLKPGSARAGGADRRRQPLAARPAESGAVPAQSMDLRSQAVARRGCAVLRSPGQRAGGGGTASAAAAAGRHCWPRRPRRQLERLPPLAQSLAAGAAHAAAPMPALNGTTPPVDPRLRHRLDGLQGGGAGCGHRGSGLGRLPANGGRSGGRGAGVAARSLWRRPAGRFPVRGVGVTGSGREIVGSLLTTCYGERGGVHPERDRRPRRRRAALRSAGGHDLRDRRAGREVHPAGGGARDGLRDERGVQRGHRFVHRGARAASSPAFEDVAQLGREALARAARAFRSGQHCSVFMAEVIDEAVAAGVEQRAIIAGLYDSIIQNYLHRVKGNRSVGQVIFCQGMPFAADALAAAVARQTGSEVIIPPNPGTVGALGIALLARRNPLAWPNAAPGPAALPRRARRAEGNLHLPGDRGCGGAGNHCRIDSLKRRGRGQRQEFHWGGACALHDKGTRKAKLPDRAPDPFREREALVRQLMQRLRRRTHRGAGGHRPRRIAALTDEFMLKGLFPFFATFLHELGFDLRFRTGADPATLKRGIRRPTSRFARRCSCTTGWPARSRRSRPISCSCRWCAACPAWTANRVAKICPIVQASPDMIRVGAETGRPAALLSPVIDVGAGNLDSPEFLESCRRLALGLGVRGARWRAAWQAAACRPSTSSTAAASRSGGARWRSAPSTDVLPVVVLGRPYTIYNTVLNSNVPAILREQARWPFRWIATRWTRRCRCSATCIGRTASGFCARPIRSAARPGVYALYCQQLLLRPGQLQSALLRPRHGGQAVRRHRDRRPRGRCGHQDAGRGVPALRAGGPRARAACAPAPNDFGALARAQTGWRDIRDRGELLLIPRMGGVAEVVAACFRGLGVRAECLPEPDAEALRLGRRQTSGKECLPMCLTLGSLLQRVEPAARARRAVRCADAVRAGPAGSACTACSTRSCWIVWACNDRVRIWSPEGSRLLRWVATGIQHAALRRRDGLGCACRKPCWTRVRSSDSWRGRPTFTPATRPGSSPCSSKPSAGDLSGTRLAGRGGWWRLFGLRDLLAAAAADLAAVRTDCRIPTVLLVGEIYVRLDPSRTVSSSANWRPAACGSGSPA